MLTIKQMREVLDLTMKEFSEVFNVPVKTLENWEYGKATPPSYVMEMLEKDVLERFHGSYFKLDGKYWLCRDGRFFEQRTEAEAPRKLSDDINERLAKGLSAGGSGTCYDDWYYSNTSGSGCHEYFKMVCEAPKYVFKYKNASTPHEVREFIKKYNAKCSARILKVENGVVTAHVWVSANKYEYFDVINSINDVADYIFYIKNPPRTRKGFTITYTNSKYYDGISSDEIEESVYSDEIEYLKNEVKEMFFDEKHDSMFVLWNK